MPNYQGGKIYKIVNCVNDRVYVGSTTQRLSQRWFRHKKTCILCPNRKIYKAINEIGIENFYIELIKLFPCTCREELSAEEGRTIRNLDSINHGYNICLAGRSPRDSVKNYYENNKEKIAAYMKIYDKSRYEKNRDRTAERLKKYREQHKREIIEQTKKYREQHKDELAEKRKQKIDCKFCNRTITKRSMPRHLKTCKQAQKQLVEGNII